MHERIYLIDLNMHSWHSIVTTSIVDQKVQGSIRSSGNFIVEGIYAFNIIDFKSQCLDSLLFKI